MTRWGAAAQATAMMVAGHSSQIDPARGAVPQSWLARLLADGRPLVMGILNVTPDSFSDGGRFLDPALAIA